MSIPSVKRNWFRPTRRKVVLVAAFIGLLMLMSAEPEPIISYSGGDPVSFDGVSNPIDNPIFQEVSPEEAAAYAKDLTERLETARVPIIGELKSSLTQKRNAQSLVILKIMLGVSFMGLLMLGAPLVLAWRYPLIRLPMLMGYSAISAGLFVLVGSILVGLYALTRYTSGLVSTAYNPQLSITESFFDFLISRADQLSEIGPTIIEPTVRAMQEGPTSPALQVLLENAHNFSSVLNVFVIIGRVAYVANSIYSLFPLVLMIAAFVFFIRNSIPTMKEIVLLPIVAANGQEQAARLTVRKTIRNIWKESLYALALIGVLLVLTMIVASLGRGAIEPALEILLNYVIAAMIYAQTESGAQPGLVLFCTGASLLFLVILLAFSTIAAILFLWRASKVLRVVTRSGASIRAERQFWVRGLAGLAWAMLIPVLYALAASPAVALFGQQAVDNRTWGIMFGLIPIALVGGLFVALWAGNGFKSLMFVRRYEPVALAAGAAGIAAVAGEQGGDEGLEAGEAMGDVADTGMDISA